MQWFSSSPLRNALTKVGGSRDSNELTAATWLIEFNRMKNEVLQSAQNRQPTLDKLNDIDCTTLPNADGKFIAALLNTLIAIEAPPNTTCFDSAFAWCESHRNQVTPPAAAALCYLVRHHDHPNKDAVLMTYAQTMTQLIAGMTAPSLAQVAYAFAGGHTIYERVCEMSMGRVMQILKDLPPNGVMLVATAFARSNMAGKDRYQTSLRTSVKACAERANVGELISFMSALDKTEPNESLLQLIAQRILDQKEQLDVEHSMPLLKLCKTFPELSSLRDKAMADLLQCSDTCPVPDLLDLASVLGYSALPESVQQRLVNELQSEQADQQSAVVVAGLVKLFSAPEFEGSTHKVLLTFVDRHLARIEAQSDTSADDVIPLLNEITFAAFEGRFKTLISTRTVVWSADQCAACLKKASTITTMPMRELFRDLGTVIQDKVANKSAPATTASFMSSYAQLRVRVNSLCTAIADRAIEIKDELRAADFAAILGGLALVDSRQPKIYQVCLNNVRAVTPNASGPEVAVLMYAYAKMAIWSFKLFARLADRAADVHRELSVKDTLFILTSLHRVDLKQPRLFEHLIVKCQKEIDTVSRLDAIRLLSAFSKLGVYDERLYTVVANRMYEDQQKLDANDLGELLMSFSRVGVRMKSLFDKFALRAVTVAPTAPPMAMANIITAFAAMRCKHAELFSIIGERVLHIKNECPSLTISAVLTAFATVGLRDDKLFIEMIPRVRHVAHHGAPQDIANVLTAYTTVSLWHYKLFVKLAERAIAVRGECRATHVAQILMAFAKVDMRYEKLFVEFSPRVQLLAQSAQPSELAAIAHAYSTVRILDTPVFQQIADRSIVCAKDFEEHEGQLLIEAYQRLKIKNNHLYKAFESLVPIAAQGSGVDEALA